MESGKQTLIKEIEYITQLKLNMSEVWVLRLHLPREESIVWVQNKALHRCPLGDRRGQPAWRNLPAGNTPPPAVDTQSEVLALLGQSSRGAVPFVRWYRQKEKQHGVVVDRPKGQKRGEESNG